MKIFLSLFLIFFIFLFIPLSNANAELTSFLSSDYYEYGEHLEFIAKTDSNLQYDIIQIEISSENFKKVYGAYSNWGMLHVGLPLLEKSGWVPGIYNVEISHANQTNYHTFGLEQFPPKLTLYQSRNIVPLNEYAFFFGQAQNSNLKDPSFMSNVLIEILDSKGNLVNDNWKSNENTARSLNEEFATKSILRPSINNGVHYFITEEEQILDENNIPVWPNGYRFHFKIDPTIYQVGHIYTVKATYDDLTESVDFIVADYTIPLSWENALR